MKITNECFEMIKSFEGLRLESYDDLQPSKPARLLTTIKGTLTIGYGHTKDVYIGQVITVQEAEAYLQQDIQKYENYVDKYVPHSLNINQYSALVSFAYNCGLGNLQKLVKNRNLNEIGNAILLYNKSGGKVLAGLVRRRTAEQKMYFTPVTISETRKTNEEIAQEVINGKWGNGTDRKKRLAEAGYNYKEIQRLVNIMLVG